MDVTLTHIRTEDGRVTHVQYLDPDKKVGSKSVPDFIEWLSRTDADNEAHVRGGHGSRIGVFVVRPKNATKYLRTSGTHVGTDDLLSLPHF